MCVSFANGILSLQTGSLPVMLHSYYYMCALYVVIGGKIGGCRGLKLVVY